MCTFIYVINMLYAVSVCARARVRMYVQPLFGPTILQDWCVPHTLCIPVLCAYFLLLVMVNWKGVTRQYYSVPLVCHRLSKEE